VVLKVKNLLDIRNVGSRDDALDCYHDPGRTMTRTLRASW
jgi:hypothetical protein